jgi:hypothetical protein
MKPVDLLTAAIRRNPFRSQREACKVTARRSIAAFGPVLTDADIRDTCIDLASGLFGEAFADAPAEQDRAIALMEEEYRKCIHGAVGGSSDSR